MLPSIRDAVAYPLRGPNRGDAVAVVWLSLLAHGLLPVVPLVPLFGVLVRAVGARTSDAAPAVLRDPVGLLRSGLGGLAVTVGYLLVPAACFFAILEYASASPADTPSLLVLVGTSVGAVALLVATYLLPVALAEYGRAGSLRAAFDPARLRPVARSGRYLLGWLTALVWLDAGGLVAVGLAGTSTLGWVVATLLGAYVLLSGTRLLAVSVAAAGPSRPDGSAAGSSARVSPGPRD